MTEAEWRILLDRDPDDAELRLAYATWLRDDADDPVAADFQEWLVRERKRPAQYTKTPWGDDGWFWFTRTRDEHALITGEMWRATARGQAVRSGKHSYSRGYASRAEAEADLLHAWRTLQANPPPAEEKQE
jgi:hypothetical protein